MLCTYIDFGKVIFFKAPYSVTSCVNTKKTNQTFNFWDLFLRFLLHYFLLELYLCHLSHFLSLWNKSNRQDEWYQNPDTRHDLQYIWMSGLTYDGLLPFSFCLLFHHFLCLNGDKQSGLLCFPADGKREDKFD